LKNLVFIPTYNESGNIKNIIQEIKKNIDTDILVIDDNSADGTSDIVREIQKSCPNVFLIQREGKLGLASAYIRGFNYAVENGYDSVCVMDADFSHNPKYLPALFNALNEYDFVIGSRYIKGGGVSNWSKKRVLVSKLGNLYARIILMAPIKDITSGFKCVRVDALKKIDLNMIKSEGYSFNVEINYLFYKNGFRIKEIPIIFEERREGASKISKKIFFEAVFKVWVFRFTNFKKFFKG